MSASYGHQHKQNSAFSQSVRVFVFLLLLKFGLAVSAHLPDLETFILRMRNCSHTFKLYLELSSRHRNATRRQHERKGPSEIRIEVVWRDVITVVVSALPSAVYERYVVRIQVTYRVTLDATFITDAGPLLANSTKRMCYFCCIVLRRTNLITYRYYCEPTGTWRNENYEFYTCGKLFRACIW